MNYTKTLCSPLFALAALSFLGQQTVAFDYSITSAGDISLTDVDTDITDIRTLFVGELVAVTLSGLEWEPNESAFNETNILIWKTWVGDKVQATGSYDLSSLPSRELPTSIDVGDIKVDKSGRHEIKVELLVGKSEESTSAEYEAFAAAASIVPLVIVLILAMSTQMVELSLLSAVFVGACMVSGNIKDGFKTTFDDYVLNALSSVDHGYVYLFTLFLSGMVGMLQKSGGMIGFTKAIAQYARSPRAGQIATFAICCCVFFDDYTNLLLTGSSVKPLTDLLFISREKIAFLVDATAAPLASLTPISSWVGFEVSLIQTEINRLIDTYGEENLTIDTSAIAVFLQSIKYRYYPIFMIILIPLLIYSQRDFGPMLIAERKARVYKRNDGGDGRVKHSGDDNQEANEPRPDTPLKAWNMAVPIVLLVFFIFYLMIKTGDDGTGEQSFTEKIEASDSYSALLWGTMGATGITLLFYLFQFVYDGEIVLPTWPLLKSMMGMGEADSRNEDSVNEVTVNVIQESAGEDSAFVVPSSRPRSLMTVYDSVEAFLCGMAKIFPALIVLTLAWASGSIMTAVGADRLFSRWITQGVSAQAMPTLSFVIAIFMALATGTSWGTMTILFPLLCVPTYQVSNGDPIIFYSTVAGILSGSVAGDHVSPISDTTVISSMSCGCKLLGHVVTQAPYATIVSLVSILFGTIPIGHEAFPNIVGVLLGGVTLGLFVYFLCAKVLDPTGRFDIVTQFWLRIRKSPALTKLQEDTIIRCQGTDEDEPILPGLSADDDDKQDEATSTAKASSDNASDEEVPDSSSNEEEEDQRARQDDEDMVWSELTV